jgi:small-conductance mechanosensitive channel
MSGTNSLETTAAALSAVLRGGIEQVFDHGAERQAIGPVTWEDLGVVTAFVVLLLALNALAAAIIRRKKRNARDVPETQTVKVAAFEAIGKPLYLLIWVFGGYMAVAPLVSRLPPGAMVDTGREILLKLFNSGFFCVVVWLVVRLTRVVDLRLGQWAVRTHSALDEFLAPLLGKGLRAVAPVAAIILALPLVGLPAAYSGFVAKVSSILIVGAVSWFLFKLVQSGRDIVLRKYDIACADNLRARTIHTQVRVITKTLYVALGVLTLGSALMVFSEVRHVGASILASAGIVSIIAGLAAQSTLANLFAGFQLALAQPIRLDDVVVVEGAFGRIEEITLTYVVVRVWDDTRLVAPLNYFITKPFQNWTRVSSNIMGQVLFWADYTLPVAELRPVVGRIVQACPTWDRRFWNLQVVETSENAMQLRILATASDSSKAWDLRCQIREEVLAFMREHYPESLPRSRAEWQQPDSPVRAVIGQPAERRNGI